jgi:hypothetical protein
VGPITDANKLKVSKDFIICLMQLCSLNGCMRQFHSESFGTMENSCIIYFLLNAYAIL